MNNEVRTICYDEDLMIEAFRFERITRAFPNHFHDYYVIGLVESGSRKLDCKGKIYSINKGGMIIFNPGDNHGCQDISQESFSYIGLNISKKIMENVCREITGKKIQPYFSATLIESPELKYCFSSLHSLIMNKSEEFEKEELFLLIIDVLINEYSVIINSDTTLYSEEIERVCEFVSKNYSSHITLEQLCSCANLSKSTLLRVFTKVKGVTPYRYLQSVRIEKAKSLLEKGVSPIDTAQLTGFSDQSHFTNSFTSFIGITPSAYRDVFIKNINDRININGEM